VAAVHVGVETAGSPLATINDLGPAAIVADFCNNAGLIVGPVLPDWRTTPIERWQCETFVDDVAVGRGHAGVPPGGPFESLRFLLELCAAALTAAHGRRLGIDRCDHGRAPGRRRPNGSRLVRRRRRGSLPCRASSRLARRRGRVAMVTRRAVVQALAACATARVVRATESSGTLTAPTFIPGTTRRLPRSVGSTSSSRRSSAASCR
jgi:hypothetical protein